jgi:hypothetical protein
VMPLIIIRFAQHNFLVNADTGNSAITRYNDFVN